MPATVAGSLTMRSCRQSCHASAPVSLIPDSTLSVASVAHLQRPILGQFLLSSLGHEQLRGLDQEDNHRAVLVLTSCSTGMPSSWAASCHDTKRAGVVSADRWDGGCSFDRFLCSHCLRRTGPGLTGVLVCSGSQQRALQESLI